MKQDQPAASRRNFLKGAALGGAAVMTTRAAGAEAQVSAPPSKPPPETASRAAAAELAKSDSAAAEIGGAADLQSPMLVKDPGSDFIVDCLRALGIDYVALNPGGSTTGLHESIINYGGNAKPELLTVTHEEVGAAMAHGYFKATNKPMALLFYGSVGLMHASMAVYNAFADRVPMIILAGNKMSVDARPVQPDWQHAALDLEPLLTGSIKWYDAPTSLTGLAEAIGRGFRIAMTEPMGPVLISIDAELQERPCEPSRDSLVIPPYRRPVQPVADTAALAEAAQLLLSAEYPVLVVNRATDSQAGMNNIVQLAELLGSAVLNKPDRLCMPNRHPLNLTGMDAAVAAKADVLLFLGEEDIWSVVNQQSKLSHRISRRAPDGAKVISINLTDSVAGKNLQEQLRFYPVDLPIDGAPEASVPHLIEAVRRAMTPEATARAAARAKLVAEDHDKLAEANRAAAAYGWNASPISTARLCAELGDVLKDEDWALVSPQVFVSNWPQRLWNMDRFYRFRGQNGAGGMGYAAPASLGAALGHARTPGRIPVAIQCDGDLMYQPGVCWTAAHHSIPLLSVMHNNQAYHAELMNVQRIANRRARGVKNTGIGTRMNKPEINFATLARSLGVWSAGPIRDPGELRPAIVKALQVIKSGQPALIDVHTQPR